MLFLIPLSHLTSFTWSKNKSMNPLTGVTLGWIWVRSCVRPGWGQCNEINFYVGSEAFGSFLCCTPATCQVKNQEVLFGFQKWRSLQVLVKHLHPPRWARLTSPTEHRHSTTPPKSLPPGLAPGWGPILMSLTGFLLSHTLFGPFRSSGGHWGTKTPPL